jgi:serine/threonine-protein kinase
MGTYRSDFGPIIALDDIADPGGAPALTSTYGLRSVCRPSGCMMTASRLGGAAVAQPTMVFDQIGENWVAVALGPDSCRNSNTDFWQVFTLKPRPDGALVGDYTATAANACADRRTVTFTRTGDVDVNRLPDPSGHPPRVVSPAGALRGRYSVTQTFPKPIQPVQLNTVVTTECLRTGERCMSYFHEPSSDIPLVFSGGNWTWNMDIDVTCPMDGEPAHMKSSGRAPLPQPPGDPVMKLTGHGHLEQTAPCEVNADFDEILTRAGD